MKTWLSKLLVIVTFLSTLSLAAADVITEATRTFNVNLDISDPQDPPQFFLETINDSAILSLTKVQVGLQLVGTPQNDNGFASDMYVALNLNLGTTSILLNRVGIITDGDIGYYYYGWDVTFSDDAAGGDIYGVDTSDGLGILSGDYEPDGRTSPTDISRPSLLSVFNGSAGNGDWRLLVGDLAEGGQMQLVSWSLILTGETTIPEPSSVALFALCGLGVVAWKKRLKRKTL